MIALSDRSLKRDSLRNGVQDQAGHGRDRPADRCAAREDARRSFQSIGVRVSLSAPAVKRRVDRLEADGVVRGLRGLVDPARFGWATHAIVALFCEGRMAAAEVRAAVEHHPEVAAAYTVAGEASAILHVRARDTSHLEEALERIRDRRGDPHADADRALDAVRAARGGGADGSGQGVPADPPTTKGGPPLWGPFATGAPSLGEQTRAEQSQALESSGASRRRRRGRTPRAARMTTVGSRRHSGSVGTCGDGSAVISANASHQHK